MKRVKLNLQSMTVPTKIGKGHLIIAQMTGNAAFPAPTPTLAVFSVAVDELETAWGEAQDGAHSKIVAMNQREVEFDNLIRQLADYVQSASGGNEEKILSAGFEVRREPSPIGIPEAPQFRFARIGKHEGEIDLRWHRSNGARTYNVQRSTVPNNAESWTTIALITKSTYTDTGLNSGSKYWYRVAAIGAAGQSSWSDPATQMAG